MILIYSISFLSCEDNEVEISPYEQAYAQLEGGVPEDKSIDINNDGQYDFEIRYPLYHYPDDYDFHDYPASGKRISGQLTPLNDNQSFRQYKNGITCPFLEEGDTIKRNNNSKSTWSDRPSRLIYISGRLIWYKEVGAMNYKYEWQDNWTVRADKTSDFFLGFKLKTSDSPKIGWMLLDANKENGEISIIESKITDSDKLIIER